MLLIIVLKKGIGVEKGLSPTYVVPWATADVSKDVSSDNSHIWTPPPSDQSSIVFYLSGISKVIHHTVPLFPLSPDKGTINQKPVFHTQNKSPSPIFQAFNNPATNPLARLRKILSPLYSKAIAFRSSPPEFALVVQRDTTTIFANLIKILSSRVKGFSRRISPSGN
jgi:hypothetical protein